ncbi:hypothetical protein [Stieleria varia]|uniref:Sulfotransferase family protein n=1 Tax=Stieleria varia TaxID=2528005 RepID=A0A5C5ZQD1_9BACT|nr:hypothetical protein [Stieleria varia]TWT89258.1 hypothetical protein Pla52n_68550 [Stieleria varia]
MNRQEFNITGPRKVFAVLGPYRGGTSLVTGILEAFEVFVGDDFFNAETGYCTYEDTRLRLTCLACFDEREGHWYYRKPPPQRVALLQTWHHWAAARAETLGRRAFGGKHPLLCKLIQEISLACNTTSVENIVFVSVNRPVDDVHRSWIRRTPQSPTSWWPRRDRRQVIDDLVQSRDNSLRGRPHIQIEFNDLIADPASTLEKFADQCGLPSHRIPDAIQRIRERKSKS